MPHFDKYGPYVYAGYGVALAIIAGLIAWSVLRAMSAKKQLDAAEGEPDKQPDKQDAKP